MLIETQNFQIGFRKAAKNRLIMLFILFSVNSRFLFNTNSSSIFSDINFEVAKKSCCHEESESSSEEIICKKRKFLDIPMNKNQKVIGSVGHIKNVKWFFSCHFTKRTFQMALDVFNHLEIRYFTERMIFI